MVLRPNIYPVKNQKIQILQVIIHHNIYSQNTVAFPDQEGLDTPTLHWLTGHKLSLHLADIGPSILQFDLLGC